MIAHLLHPQTAAAIEAEHLTDDTGRSEDIAYDIGIDHAAKAVRNLSPDT